MALRVDEHDVRVDRVVAFAEDLGLHEELLVDDRLGRALPAVDAGADVDDGDAPDGRHVKG